jgi:hypothetical protein
MIMRFVNPLDARLPYGRAYHYGCKMVAFTQANIFTNYDDLFPRSHHIHLLGFMQQQQAPNQQGGRIYN